MNGFTQRLVLKQRQRQLQNGPLNLHAYFSTFACLIDLGDAVASWLRVLDSGSIDRVLDLGIVSCTWARQFTLIVSLTASMSTNLMLEATLQWTSIPFRGGVETSLVTSATETTISSL